MKPGVDWSFNPPVDFEALIKAALIPEDEYDREKHGEISFRVSSVEEFFELFPDHIEPNMAILATKTTASGGEREG